MTMLNDIKLVMTYEHLIDYVHCNFFNRLKPISFWLFYITDIKLYTYVC